MRATLWYAMMLAIGVLAVAATLAFAVCCLSITITTPAHLGKSTFSSDPKDISCLCDTEGICTVTWSSENIGGGVTESWPSGNTGTSVTLRLTTLPNDNSHFGPTWVQATDGAVSDKNDFDLFFSEEATNNPGEVEVPNWYYYWSDTLADYGTHNYDSGLDSCGITYFDEGAWRSYIGTEANETPTAPLKYPCTHGIDCFAQVCRHEERHRQDFSSLWGAGTDRNNDDDPDVDWLPTDNGTVTENSLGTPYHEGGYNPNVEASVPDHWHYGPLWRDCEDYCMHRHAVWNNGDADSVDWANPGKQY